MCFLFLWNTLCLDNCIAKLLSQKIEVGSFSVCLISSKIILSQTAWKTAVVVATYYASADGMRTMGFFLRCPRDEICTQMKSITRSSFPIINTSCKITVSVPCENTFWWMSVPKAISKCACNLSHNSFSNFLVRFFGRLHKYGNKTDNIHQTRSSCSQIH